jgi:hypothetical protein
MGEVYIFITGFSIAPSQPVELPCSFFVKSSNHFIVAGGVGVGAAGGT